MSNVTNVEHPFEPIYNENSTILILGTIPSVKSRKTGFYYAHGGNAFWRIIAYICDYPVPDTVDAKKKLLLDNHIAIWDVCKNCDIEGSKDSSIKSEIPADIPGLLKKAPIKRIYANGQKAAKQYKKFVQQQTGIDIIPLASSSGAYNHKKSGEKITEQDKKKIWKEKIELI